MSSATTAAHRPPVRAPLWLVGVVLWGAVALIIAGHVARLGDSAALSTLGVIFTSIVVEALPFILVGAVVSAALATFVSDAAFGRIARLPRALQVPGAAAAGVCFPVCECGSVPVARRLLARGVDPAAGITFMLAAPVLNPIVLASTWIAYGARGDALQMTAARAVLGLTVAVTVGLAVARFGGTLLRGGEDTPALGEHHHDLHDHDADLPSDAGRAASFAAHMTSDFVFMGRFLILGAAASAVIQTVLPQSVLSGIGGAPVVAVLTMMALAIALSLCSEADAFVAVSFTAFPLSAQLAFLVMGPAFDAKLAALYGATFRRRFTMILLAVSIPLTLVGSLALGALIL
jgi:uncharacterized protein